MGGVVMFLTRNAYMLATRSVGIVRHQNSLLSNRWIDQVKPRHPCHVIFPSIVILLVILNGTLAVQGPLGAYCGVRCAESGISTEFTNPGRCWVRLLNFYMLTWVLCPPTVYYAGSLAWHVHKMHRSNRGATVEHTASGQQPGGKQAASIASPTKRKSTRRVRRYTRLRQRLIVFSIFMAVACAGSGLVRLRSSLDPDPSAEGRVSASEVFGCLISIFMLY